ncbi:MAG: cupin domain-containing protein [Candidatus Dormibacteraeota bacterium]|nr:cupin domain-containing protein [Candidatus Dormibacteraeota bacterium]
MDYVHTLDLAALAGQTERSSQALVGPESGVAGCSINCVTTPAGEGSPAGLHTHQVDQVFYLLQGTMSLDIAGVRSEAGPGTLVVFPAGVPHRNWNGGTEPTVHLAINAPQPDPSVPFATSVPPH